MLLGYARVSTLDQNLALQRHALAEAGCEKIFNEQMSGAVMDRPSSRLIDADAELPGAIALEGLEAVARQSLPPGV